jgi:hypothetical protein
MGMGGFHNLKVEISASLHSGCRRNFLSWRRRLISILVGPLLSHKHPYVALKYNKEGLD